MVGTSRRLHNRSIVDLPAPDGPNTAVTPPSVSVALKWFRARTPSRSTTTSSKAKSASPTATTSPPPQTRRSNPQRGCGIGLCQNASPSSVRRGGEQGTKVTAVGRTPAVGERDPLAAWVFSVRAGANVARCDQRGDLLAQRGSIQLHGLGQQAHVDLLDGG